MATKRANTEVTKSPSDVENTTKRSTRQNMKRCNVCMQQIMFDFVDDENLTVMCRKCNDRYHSKCVGLASDFVYNLIQNSKKGWLCYGCSCDTFKYVERMEERLTNVEKQVQLNTHNLKQTTASIELGLGSLDEKYDGLINRLTEEIEALKNQITSDGLAINNDEIVKTVTEATLRNLQGSVNSTTHNNDMKYIHALQRKNNLMIQNIPQDPRETKESLIDKVMKLSNALGVSLQPQNVSIAMRLNNKIQTQNDSQIEVPVVLVKFCDVAIKDELFDAYISKIINKSPVTQQALGYKSSERIYINHHLSPELANLKRKAVDLKKKGKIAKVNVRYNNIRVNINNKWHKIDTEEDLLQLNAP